MTASYDRTSPVTRSCSPLRGRAPAIHELRARVLTIMGALSACGGSILEIVLSGWAEGSLLIRRWACVRSFSFIYSFKHFPFIFCGGRGCRIPIITMLGYEDDNNDDDNGVDDNSISIHHLFSIGLKQMILSISQ